MRKNSDHSNVSDDNPRVSKVTSQKKREDIHEMKASVLQWQQMQSESNLSGPTGKNTSNVKKEQDEEKQEEDEEASQDKKKEQ